MAAGTGTGTGAGMDSARITHPTVIAALKAGQVVEVEAPGWQDTGAGPCPVCGLPCWHFLADPDVRFVYRIDGAHPHRCGKALRGFYEDPYKVRRLQAMQRELHELQNDWDRVQAQREKS